MNSFGFVFGQVAVMTAVTFLIRALAFVIFRKGKKTPDFVLYLGKVLPMAIMGMLVVYCLKGVRFQTVTDWLPSLVGVVSVVLLHVWKKNTLFSILGGTIIYMILVNVM